MLNNFQLTHTWLLISFLYFIVVFIGGCGASHYMYTKEIVVAEGNNVAASNTSAGNAGRTGISKAIIVDAKQRLVFSGSKKNSAGDLAQIICAEPSPDALSAIVSGIAIGANVGKDTLNSTFSNSESAASIGLRTQSIQLLRDGMYRICEAYYSGVISATQVNGLLERYQDTMVAILAIESLTGAVTPKQVVLNSESSASLGKSINEASKQLENALEKQLLARQQLDNANQTVAKAKADLTEAEGKKEGLKKQLNNDADTCQMDGKLPDDNANSKKCPEYLDAIKTFETAKTTHAEAEQNAMQADESLAIANENVIIQKQLIRDALSAGSTATKSDGKFSTNQATISISDQAAQHISEAVTEIVDKSLLRNDVIKTCLSIAGAVVQPEIERQKLLSTGIEKYAEKFLALEADEKTRVQAQTQLNTYKSNISSSFSDDNIKTQQAMLNKLKTDLACEKILSAYAARFASGKNSE